MNRETLRRLERLRGSLPAEEPGARGLERVARNPGCQRLRALTVAGITPATALRKIYGESADEGQSPFALAAGNRFERRLFESGAARLLDLYRREGWLMTHECKVVNVPDLAPGFQPADLLLRRTVTEDLLRRKLAGDRQAPNLIIKPRVPVPLVGIEHGTEPDALVAADEEAFYRPIEIKSYSDRAGKTAPADLRSACRQAAVAVVGLRHVLRHIGAADPEALVPDQADLILKRPGSYRPTLQPMTLRGEVESLLRAMEEAPRNLEELEAMLGPGATLAQPETLDSIPNHYGENCREYCALADHCRQQAIRDGDLIVLGSSAREELSAAGSVHRALSLLHGQGRAPTTPDEAFLQQRLREALQQYREVLGDVR